MAGKGSIEIPITAELAGGAGELQKLLADLQKGVDGAARKLNDSLGGTVSKQLVIDVVTNNDGSRSLVASEKERLSIAGQVEQKLKSIDRIQRGSVTSLRGQLNEAKQTRDQIAKYTVEINRSGQAVRVLNDEWTKANAKVAQFGRQLEIAGASTFWGKAKAGLNAQGFINFLNGLTELTQGFQSAAIVVGQVTSSVNNLINSLADLQQFKLSFVAAGAGEAGGAQALAEASRIALGLGTSLKTARESFQQLTPVVLNSGGTIQDVSAITETLSSRFAAYGISGDKARRVTNGVIQAFAKGKLQAEELTQQISEADPAFKTDFANALGVSTKALEELVKAGQITSDVLLQTLPKLSKSDLLYGKLGDSVREAAKAQEDGSVTIDQVRNKIDALNQLSFERFAKGFKPLIDAFLTVSAVVADFFDRVSKLEVLKTLGSIAGGIVNQFANLLDIFLRLAESALVVLQAVDSIVGPLLRIPAVANLVGAAILAKLVSPILGFGKAIKEAVSGVSGFIGKVRGIAPAAGDGAAGFAAIAKNADGSVASLGRLTVRLNDVGRTIQANESNLKSLEANLRDTQSALNAQKASAKLTGNVGNPAAIKAYEDRIKTLTSAIDTQKNTLVENRTNQLALENAIQKVGAGTGKTAEKVGLMSRALTAAKGVGASLVSVWGALGGVLAAVALGTAAYNTVYGESNRITEESKARLASLDAALKDINGTTEDSKDKITGLALVWEKLALVIAGAIDAVKGLFDNLGSGAESAKGPLAELEKALSALAIVGGSALAGFLLLGGPVGAGIGALVGVLIALAASGDDAEVKLRKTEKASKALGQAASQEAKKIGQISDAIVSSGQKAQQYKAELADLQKQLEQAQTAKAPQSTIDKLLDKIAAKQEQINKQAKGFDAAYNAAQNSLKGLIKLQEEQGNKVEALNAEKQKVGAQSGGFSNLAAKEATLDKQRIALQRELAVAKEKSTKAGSTKKEAAEYNEIKKKLREVEVAYKQAGDAKSAARGKLSENDVKKQVKAYDDLNNRLYVEQSLYNGLVANVKSATAALDKAAASQGLLTSAQKESANTIANLNEKLQQKQAILENETDPDINPAAFEKVNKEISAINVDLQRTKDLSREIQALTEARLIKFRVDNGSLKDSIANAKRVVDALEETITLGEIDSPDLPGLILELEQARLKTEALDGARAAIEVSVIGGAEAAQSLNQLQRVVSALNTQKAALDFRSPEFSRVADDARSAQNFLEAAGKSSGELRRQLATTSLERQIKGMQSLSDAAKRKNDEEIRGLEKTDAAATRAEAKRVKGYDKQIEQIRDVSEASSKSFDRQLEGLAREAEAIQRNADSKIKSIEAAQRADDAATRQKLANLDKLSPAEQRIEDKRIGGLQKQASFGKTQDERDEAQAQLDQIAREKEKAKIQEEADQRRMQREEQQRQIEDQRQQELLKNQQEQEKVQEERRKKEEDFQARLKKLEEDKQAAQEAADAAAEARRVEIEANKEAARIAEQESADAIKAAQEELTTLAQQEKDEKDQAAKKVLEQRDAYIATAEQAKSIMENSIVTRDQSEKTRAELQAAEKALSNGSATSAQIAGNLQSAAGYAANLVSSINSLKSITINIQAARALGGPVTAGQTYTVNELGKEGFLSSTGVLSRINKPAYGDWRAPTSGTVIPANIMRTLRVPSGSTRVSGPLPGVSPTGSGLKRLFGALQASLAPQVRPSEGLSELAAVQAQQAMQIGRLSRAVTKLADKDMNVHVNVKQNGSADYLGMLNRRM